MRRVLVVTAFLISFGAVGAEASSPLQQPTGSISAERPQGAAQQVEAQPQAGTKHGRSKLDLTLPSRGSVVPVSAEKKPPGNTGRGPSSQGPAIDPWFPARGLGVQVSTTW